MSPNQAIPAEKLRRLADLHRDLSQIVVGKAAGWLGLTAGKPQGGGLRVWGVASGSAASQPNSGSPDLVEFGEESRKINNGPLDG